jgi:lipopolysaccharide/colanic/teichoic acid biosynthesis glycosyltransferase
MKPETTIQPSADFEAAVGSGAAAALDRNGHSAPALDFPLNGEADGALAAERMRVAWETAAGEPMAVVEDPWLFRAAQRAIAAIVLVLMSPVMVIVAAAVKLLSPGPILYGGRRVGQGMREFTIFKFRTLRVGAEAQIGQRLLTPQDRCYIPMGRFLKRTKLDEIPQLWNVIRGDMNIVGPRPVRPIFLREFLDTIPGYAKRFQMKPGITGLAQLRGGYFTSPAAKLRYELWYLRNRRPLLDLQIIGLTLFKLLNRWITLGGLLFVLFVFVSFMPSQVLSGFYVYAFGVRASLVHIAIAAMGLWLIARKRTSEERITLYRTPLAIPMGVFIALGLVSAALSVHHYQAARGALYYLATGFLITSTIVNGTFTRLLVERALQVVALSAVLISLVGIIDLAMLQGLRMDTLMAGWLSGPGMTATLGSPVVLATYLVLGVPALLYQLSQPRTDSWRDFWMAATTVTFIGILLTKSAIGLVAVSLVTLLVVWRLFPAAVVPCAIVFGPFVYLAATQAAVEWRQFLCGPDEGLCTFIADRSWTEFLFGLGPRTLGEYGLPAEMLQPEAASAHVRLLVENGFLGWLALLWILGTALVVLYRGHREASDPSMRALMWAVFCSVAGFVITLQRFSAFENLTLQVYFWGLLGIGMGAAVRLGPRRREYAIVLKLGH